MTTYTSPNTFQGASTTQGAAGQCCTIPFDQINEPGCYVCNWSGHLIRVPQDGVAPGRSPLLSICGNGPLTVTRLTNDPYIPVTKARLIAANFNVFVNF